MGLNYAVEEVKENTAKAYGRDLDISTKNSIEICNTLRGLKLQRAKTVLQEVIDKKTAIEMKRFNRDTAHKVGIAAGKYPINAAKKILKLLESAESNALNKGLNTQNMEIEHISANKASRPYRYGRHRGRKAKRTHIQVILLEKEKKKTEDKKKAKKKVNKKGTKK